MKTLLICSIIGLCFIVQGSSSERIIKCYVCENCDVLHASLLNTCPFQEVTNSPFSEPPTTFFTDFSTISTEESSSGSESTPLETIPTSVSSSEPTQKVTSVTSQTEETITETSKTEITTAKTEETEEPTRTTIVIELPTNAIPQSTETLPQSSTGSSSQFYSSTNGISETPNTSPTESSELPSEQTSSVEGTTLSVVTNPSVSTDTSETQPALTEAPESSTSKINFPPGAQSPSQSFKPETVYSIAPESILQPFPYNQPYQIFNRNRRGIRNSRAAPDSYHCYSIDILDGDKKRKQKGCVRVPEEKSACEVLENEFGKSVSKCKICSYDECNSSSSLNYSLITLVMVLVVSFYFKI